MTPRDPVLGPGWNYDGLTYSTTLGAGVRATVAQDATGWWWSVSWPSEQRPPLLPDGPSRRGRRPSRSGHAATLLEAQAAALRASTEGRP